MIPIMTQFKAFAQGLTGGNEQPQSGIMAPANEVAPVAPEPAVEAATKMADALDTTYARVEGYSSVRDDSPPIPGDVDLEVYRKYGSVGSDEIGQIINMNNLDKAVEQAMALFPEPTGNVTFEKSPEGTDAFLRRMILLLSRSVKRLA